MTNTIRKKTLSVLLSIVMLLSVLGCLTVSVSAESSVAGIWNGSTTAANGTVYSLSLTLSENETYTLVTSYTMGEDTYHETENGTYAVNGTAINFTGDKLIVEAMENTFDAGNSEGSLDGSTMTVTRHASFMAKSMGKDPVAIALTKGNAPASPVFGDTLVSGTYELTADSYDPSAGMKMAADIIIDTDAKTFELWRTTMSGEYSKRSEGAISFDETTGVYTVNFTTPADKSTTFTFDLINSGITFTSPLYFGAVAMNVTDDDGHFLPYTAYPKAEPFEDTLVSGTYELTADSYDPSAGMKMAADIIIDTDAKTFELWRTTMSGEYSKRSEGTIAFDSATGVYTINFTNPADKTTTFTYNYETKGITFTNPLYFGAVAMNVTDDDGNFLPYTAYPKAEAVTYEDNLVSGTYELTADSYDPSAGMKMAADIIIDTDAKTFELWRTMASGDYSKRSEGTITFDTAAGVYTINFTSPADKTTTFTYDAETKGVTFTSPLYFGAVAMNVTDDDGNFIPYTAKLIGGGNDATNPQTGDNITLWIILMIFSFASIVGIAVCGKRKSAYSK